MLVQRLYLSIWVRFFRFSYVSAIDAGSIFRTLPIILIYQPFGAYDMERRAYQKINGHRLSTFTHIDKHMLDNVAIPV